MPRRLSFLTRSPRSGARRSLLVIAAAGALALGGCQSGADGFNDESNNDEAPDVAMVRSLMEGLGAVDAKTEKKIEYTPRAPLAMPSTVDNLPPPEEQEVVANWPEGDNSDLKKIKEIYADTNYDGQRDGGGRSSPVQSRGIKQLATSGSQRDFEEERRAERNSKGGRTMPDELHLRVGVAKDSKTAVIDANGEPVRRYLIEPPVDYSRPSADAPFVAPAEVKDRPRTQAEIDEQLMRDTPGRMQR